LVAQAFWRSSRTPRAIPGAPSVPIADRVYVLHFFQEKSKRGIATPKKEIDLIKRRLRDAVEHGRAGRT
jgi:hypothetical protein